MNHTYTLIWNAALATWVVAPEHTRRRGKGSARRAGSRALLTAALLSPALGFASGSLPGGGEVVSGVGNIGGNGQHMVIDQGSHKLAINWQSFNIGSGNSVTFNQPGADSIALNRVLGSDGSKILGNLNANGQVFLINPNGVLFGAGAQVDVGALVASTLDISVGDFNAGNYRFQGNGTNASVINHGSIMAADGGAVALLGGTVRNDGIIVANLGTVALAAGDAMTLDFAGDGLLNVQIDAKVKDVLVENNQLIQADGGNVILSARAADALLETVVNNTGVIQARTLSEREGKIVLLGDFDGGTVQVAGTLDASAPDAGNGGFIDTSGAYVKIASGTQVTTKANNGTTGTWLIDPTDFTVSAGNASPTNSGVGVDTINTALQTSNVTVQTTATGNEAGDIHVNAAVTWDADTALTLNAHGDIHINAAITATGENAGLNLNHGGYVQNGSVAAGTDYHVQAPITLSGDNASFSVNGNAYTLIRSMADLQAMNGDLSGRYALAHNLDASGTTYTQALVGHSANFNGTFTGLGHTINDLVIESAATQLGLFGRTGTEGVIRDVGLNGGSVTHEASSGGSAVGALVGSNLGNIRNVFSNTAITVSKLPGPFEFSTQSVGGLVGTNLGTIVDAYATGRVSGTASWELRAGGLVGTNTGSIFNAYATGAVDGSSSGQTAMVGGLVGWTSGIIQYVYATGSASAIGAGPNSAYVGGLSGRNSGETSDVHASGSVSGSGPYVGGLLGLNTGTLRRARWDQDSTGQVQAVGASSGAAIGSDLDSVLAGSRYTHAGYQSLGTWAPVPGTSNVYTASDANGVQWIMIEGQTRPFLASEYNTTVRNAHQLQLMAYDLTADYTLGNDIDASATSGSNPSGMWSVAGFSPIGSDNTNIFTGRLDGQHHVIEGLNLNRAGQEYVGLFGFGSTDVRNLGLDGLSVVGGRNTGGLLGWLSSGSIENVWVAGSVAGGDNVGGLVGFNNGAVRSTYSDVSTSGGNFVGGLTGLNGVNSVLRQVYTLGNVSASGPQRGGIVGAGGDVAQAFYAGTDASGAAINQGVGGPGTRLSRNDLMKAETFAGWDLDSQAGTGSTWRIYEGQTTPLLRSFLRAVTATVTVPEAQRTYDGTTQIVRGTGYSLSDSGASLLGNAVYEDVATRDAGMYLLSMSGLYSGQRGYDVAFNSTDYTVSKAALTVTANDAGKVYDGQSFSGGNGVTYSGLVNGETAAVLNGSVTYGGNAQGATNAGDYVLSVDGLSADNYTITYQDGALSIERAALTVTVSDASKTYDGQAFSGGSGVTYSGFVSSETADVLGGSLTYAGSSQGAINAGEYVLAATGLSADNYAITYQDGALSIERAVLAVTANDANKVYDGQDFSGGNGVTYSGFVNGETSAVLDGSIAYGGSAQGAIGAGDYTISVSGLDANNYIITFNDGTLSVERAELTVSANDYSKVYDAQGNSGGAGVGYSGFVNGETAAVLGGSLSYGGTSQGASNVGTYVLSVAGLSADNYVITYTDGVRALTPAALVIAADNARKTFGQTLDLDRFTVHGLMGNDIVSSVQLASDGAAAHALVGNYAITAQDAVGVGLSNYAISYVEGVLEVGRDVVMDVPREAALASLSVPDPLQISEEDTLSLQVVDAGIKLPAGMQ